MNTVILLNIFQVILIITLFILVKFAAYKWVNQDNYPEWLDYRPFNCFRCASFWSLITAYATIGLIFSLWITLAGGIALAILDTIAYGINQKNKTIRI